MILLCLLTGPYAWARPPSEILLSYDYQMKQLHIDIKHVTNDISEHRIRKLTIYKNDTEVDRIHFSAQTSATGLVTDVAIEAAPEDVLRVEAVCSEAGRGEASLTVTCEDPCE